LLTKLVDESVKARDALKQEIGSYKERREDASVDPTRVAALKDRLEEALDRNRKREDALAAVRQDLDKERIAPGTDTQRRTALERDIAELDRRIETYRTRAEAIMRVDDLLERRRIDLAERVLGEIARADGVERRPALTKAEKAEDEKRVEQLRQNDQAQAAVAEASRFAVLDRKFDDVKPVRELWERAAQSAREDASLEGRALYNRAMDEFKKLLVDKQDKTAQEARALFEKDGFRFAVDQRGELAKQLPLLNDPQVESRIDMARHADLLRISGQHLTKIADGGDPVAANNLSFMIARDNMQMDVKGALSEHVRQKVVDRLKAEGIDDDREA
jgi:hypothetical protein